MCVISTITEIMADLGLWIRTRVNELILKHFNSITPFFSP